MNQNLLLLNTVVKYLNYGSGTLLLKMLWNLFYFKYKYIYGWTFLKANKFFQDENWGENTTAVTGNTSEQSGSVEEVSLWPTDPETGIAFLCHRYIGSMFTAIISVIAFLSPLAMVVLPKIGW